MTAYHFTLAGGRLLAHVLVAPQARYACVRWRSAACLSRFVVPDHLWEAVAEELRRASVLGHLPALSVVERETLRLANRSDDGLETAFINSPSIVPAAGQTFDNALDDYLHAQVFLE